MIAPDVALIITWTVTGVRGEAGVAEEEQPLTAHVKQLTTARNRRARTARERLLKPASTSTPTGPRNASILPVCDPVNRPESYGLGEVGDEVSAMDTTTLCVPEAANVTVLELKLQAACVGSPEQVSATAPVKPFADVNEIVAEPG